MNNLDEVCKHSDDIQTCSRCIFDSTIPSIGFDDDGVCTYCTMVEGLAHDYKTGTAEGEATLQEIIKDIKHAGRKKKYDIIVGVSGGTDSSFMLIKALEWGLRPLAVHYDNTWNTAIATENIRKMLTKLDIDLYTHVVDNQESNDIIRSFFKASVPDLDCPTDIALAEVLYRAASKYGIKYIFEGHSFITEGVSPMGTLYMDGRYIKEVHKKFGNGPMKTYPNMNFFSFMKWVVVKRIKKIRPFWYIDYSKEAARELLEKEYDWQYYGGHHLENRITAFHHSYYNPVKFSMDNRKNTICADIRLGKITREEGFAILDTPHSMEDDLLDYYKKRLELSDQEFDKIMALPHKTYKDYPTYKKLFERLRPIFFILAKANLVPMSFYLKYCFPQD